MYGPVDYRLVGVEAHDEAGLFLYGGCEAIAIPGPQKGSSPVGGVRGTPGSPDRGVDTRSLTDCPLS